jgi:predicted RNase H-like nuclease (RuvC/YqgF family)
MEIFEELSITWRILQKIYDSRSLGIRAKIESQAFYFPLKRNMRWAHEELSKLENRFRELWSEKPSTGQLEIYKINIKQLEISNFRSKVSQIEKIVEELGQNILQLENFYGYDSRET